jgi:hypothetical protein
MSEEPEVGAEAVPESTPEREAEPAKEPVFVPLDPWKGLRGVMSAILVFEAVSVLLGLLVVTKFNGNGGLAGVLVILVLTVGMILAPRYLSRPWGNKLVVVLQVGLIVAGVLAPVLGAMGILFGLVWAAIWFMRRDVAAKLARGELASQQPARMPPRE